MSGSRDRRLLNIGLCVLLVAGSTSASIRHNHDQGGVPHAHGFAQPLLFSTAPVATAVRLPSEPRVQHGHLVILGFEFYAGETGTSDSSSLDEPCVKIGVPAATDSQISQDDCSRPAILPLPDSGLTVSPVTLSYTLASTPSLPTDLPARCVLCDRARCERSGVSLI